MNKKLRKEIRYNLGLSDDKPDDPLSRDFIEIQKLFDMKAQNCFFCSSIYHIDPNEADNIELCLMCAHKLGLLLSKIDKDINLDRFLYA